VSLTHANWRYVGSQSFSVASLAAVMDALHTLATASQYADSSSRTQGSGSAGTWSRVQVSGSTECLHVTPATSAINHRILIAGASYTPSPSPVMCSPDNYSANTLNVGLVKNAGSFVSWNATDPFTSGQNFGYWKLWPTSAGSGNVYLWESKDSIAIAISNSSGSATYGCIAGAILDPESDDTTTDAESDGAMYGIITSGGSSISSSFWGGGFGAAFLAHSASNQTPHAGVFSPGSASILTMSPTMTFPTSPTSTGLKTRSGRFARIAITMRSSSPDNLLGRLREVYAFCDGQTPARLTSGGNTIGYIYSGSTTSQVDSILLEH
jgi:hypothetical protein